MREPIASRETRLNPQILAARSINAKADEKKEERIADICALCQKAADQVDEITLSVDEMTGIQALERIAEELPISEGKPVAREFEYKRHGTQTLTAAIRVAFGAVYAHCGDTRTEADFSRLIARTLHKFA